MSGEPISYYLQKRSRILAEVERSLPFFRKTVTVARGEDLEGQVIPEVLARFEALLPNIPYIGGDQNRLTSNLYLSAALLAFFQVLSEYGYSKEEAARLIYQATEAQYAAFPYRQLLRLSGWLTARGIVLGGLRRGAQESQLKSYPGDWVYSFVEGDGKTFDWGVDYTECGICKYYHDHGADELVAYLCWLDYPMTKAMGLSLTRTTTLAQGGQKCDFRFRRKRHNEPEIVPDFV